MSRHIGVQGVVVRPIYNDIAFLLWSPEFNYSICYESDVDIRSNVQWFDLVPGKWLEYDAVKYTAVDFIETRAINFREPIVSKDPSTSFCEPYESDRRDQHHYRAFVPDGNTITFKEFFRIPLSLDVFNYTYPERAVEGNFIKIARISCFDFEELKNHKLLGFMGVAVLDDFVDIASNRTPWKIIGYECDGKGVSLSGLLSLHGRQRHLRGGKPVPLENVTVQPDPLRATTDKIPSRFSTFQDEGFADSLRRLQSNNEQVVSNLNGMSQVAEREQISLTALVVYVDNEACWLFARKYGYLKFAREFDFGLGAWISMVYKSAELPDSFLINNRLISDVVYGCAEPPALKTRCIRSKTWPLYNGIILIAARVTVTSAPNGTAEPATLTQDFLGTLYDIDEVIPHDVFTTWMNREIIVEVTPNPLGWDIKAFHGKSIGVKLGELKDSWIPYRFDSLTKEEFELFDALRTQAQEDSLEMYREEPTRSVENLKNQPDECYASSESQEKLAPLEDEKYVRELKEDNKSYKLRKSLRHDPTPGEDFPCKNRDRTLSTDSDDHWEMLPSLKTIGRNREIVCGVIVRVCHTCVVLFVPLEHCYKVVVAKEDLVNSPFCAECVVQLGEWMRLTVEPVEWDMEIDSEPIVTHIGVSAPEPFVIHVLFDDWAQRFHNGVFEVFLTCDLTEKGNVARYECVDADYFVLQTTFNIPVLVPAARIQDLFIDNSFTASFSIRFWATRLTVRQMCIPLHLIDYNKIEMAINEDEGVILNYDNTPESDTEDDVASDVTQDDVASELSDCQDVSRDVEIDSPSGGSTGGSTHIVETSADSEVPAETNSDHGTVSPTPVSQGQDVSHHVEIDSPSGSSIGGSTHIAETGTDRDFVPAEPNNDRVTVPPKPEPNTDPHSVSKPTSSRLRRPTVLPAFIRRPVDAAPKSSAPSNALQSSMTADEYDDFLKFALFDDPALQVIIDKTGLREQADLLCRWVKQEELRLIRGE